MIRIYNQNDQLCFVEKPPGTLSVPSRLGELDKRVVVGRELEKQLSIQVYPLHRLDFEVSGLMVFALTKEAHRVISLEWENKLVKKTYRAVSVSQSSHLKEGMYGTWRSLLVKGKKRAFEAEWGKQAITEWEVLNQFPLSSAETLLYWQLNPITGRSHQLRFELSKQGSPIVGDNLYGGSQNPPCFPLLGQEIGLRSHKIEFTSSFKSQNLNLFKGLPSAFVAEDTLTQRFNQAQFV